MAKDNKKLVQAITSQEENFAQWYTDICVKAELVEYSSVKGFIILRPYGQAIWELIQKDIKAIRDVVDTTTIADLVAERPEAADNYCI